MNQDQLLTLDQVADRLQVSRATVRRLVDRGQLPVIKIGRSVRVRPVDLDALIAARLKEGDAHD